MNTKFEYNGQRINRISLSSNRMQNNCDICGHGFHSNAEVKEHTHKFHTRMRCENCDCDYISFGQSGLNEHTHRVHSANT